MPNTQNATTPTTPTTPTTAATAAITLLTAVATFARYHTRGITAMCSYVVQGCKGIVFAHCAQFANGVPPATLTFTVLPMGAVVPQGSTLLTYRGPLAQGTRSGYAALGCPVMVVHNSMLPTPVPQAMVVNAVLAAPATTRGKHTSAVVAALHYPQPPLH